MGRRDIANTETFGREACHYGLRLQLWSGGLDVDRKAAVCSAEVLVQIPGCQLTSSLRPLTFGWQRSQRGLFVSLRHSSGQEMKCSNSCKMKPVILWRETKSFIQMKKEPVEVQ